MAWLLAALIVLHVAAVIQHQVIDRDGLLAACCPAAELNQYEVIAAISIAVRGGYCLWLNEPPNIVSGWAGWPA